MHVFNNVCVFGKTRVCWEHWKKVPALPESLQSVPLRKGTVQRESSNNRGRSPAPEVILETSCLSLEGGSENWVPKLGAREESRQETYGWICVGDSPTFCGTQAPLPRQAVVRASALDFVNVPAVGNLKPVVSLYTSVSLGDLI